MQTTKPSLGEGYYLSRLFDQKGPLHTDRAHSLLYDYDTANKRNDLLASRISNKTFLASTQCSIV